MSRIGFNVHAITANLDKGRLLTHVEQSQPPWMLVMDGLGLAQDISHVSPHTQVIHRAYPDEEIWKQKTPAQWIELKRREIQDTPFWAYTVNEQGLSDNLCNWLTEVIEKSDPVGMQLVVGNLSAGTPQATDWTRPPVLRLLQACDQHRDRVVLGLHEYACGVITSGFLGGWPDNAGVAPVPDNAGKGRNLVPFENWPFPNEVAQITRFHCGRFKFLIDACVLIKLKPPRIVLTEHGFDDMSDIKTWALRQPQTPPYTSFRGWKSLENFWRAHYQVLGWTPQRAMFEQLAYADRALYQNSPVEGQLIYCYGQSSAQWDQFDVSGATEFLKLVAEQKVTVPPPPPPPSPAPPPIDSTTAQALKLIRDHLTQSSSRMRQMSLELATISDDLLKNTELLDALIGVYESKS